MTQTCTNSAAAANAAAAAAGQTASTSPAPIGVPSGFTIVRPVDPNFPNVG